MKKKVIDVVESYLERCVQLIVKINLVESLLRSENLEISRKCVWKHATYGDSNIFQLFDIAEKSNQLVASRRRWLESQGSNDARQENGRNEWCHLGYQRAKAKVPPSPNSTLQTPLSQQSSSSVREEEDQREMMEERLRRRIAFENLAKGMLRYLDSSNEVQVGKWMCRCNSVFPFRKWHSRP